MSFLRVNLAKTAGFCFGVKRAVDLVYTESENNENVYTFGPIIHNDEVVNDLAQKGVNVINTIEELMSLDKGTVIIRSHGVSKDVYDIIAEKGLKIVDATCPFVRKIHKIVSKRSAEGYDIIIVGSSSHPEVEGIKGWCTGTVDVIDSVEGVDNLEKDTDAKVCVVSQTTFNYVKFNEIQDAIKNRFENTVVENTICNATEERQTEAYELAKSSDAMIVIGGKHSSNTQKLYKICKNECENTIFIQTHKDLNLEDLKSYKSIGITAGASTPNNIIKEVYTLCQI